MSVFVLRQFTDGTIGNTKGRPRAAVSSKPYQKIIITLGGALMKDMERYCLEHLAFVNHSGGQGQTIADNR
jgi:hypothetical protein